MQIVYMTITGQTRKFVSKLGMDSFEINQANPFVSMDKEFLLVVPTYDEEATSIVNDFLETGDNISLCAGVCGGGNRNFGNLFCFTAKDIAKEYTLPLIHLFEFQGSDNDVNNVKERIGQIESEHK